VFGAVTLPGRMSVLVLMILFFFIGGPLIVLSLIFFVFDNFFSVLSFPPHLACRAVSVFVASDVFCEWNFSEALVFFH